MICPMGYMTRLTRYEYLIRPSSCFTNSGFVVSSFRAFNKAVASSIFSLARLIIPFSERSCRGGFIGFRIKIFYHRGVLSLEFHAVLKIVGIKRNRYTIAFPEKNILGFLAINRRAYITSPCNVQVAFPCLSSSISLIISGLTTIATLE